MTGFKIKREIFASLPAIDDRLEDLTQEQRDNYVEQLYKNTKKVIKQGVLIPIKEGHNTDQSERLHGHLVGVEHEYKEAPVPHYVIMGEIFLDKELYELYDNGNLPAVSIEIADSANLSAYTGNEGDRVGQYIVGVALCGTNPVAMPQLEAVKDESPQPYAIYIRLLGEKKYNFTEYGGIRMDPKMIKEKLINGLMKLVDSIMMPESEGEVTEDVELKPKDEVEAEMRSKFEGKEDEEEYEGKEDKASMDEEKDDEYKQQTDSLVKEKDDLIATLQAENAALKKDVTDKVSSLEDDLIEKDFQLLASEGKIAAEQKEDFVRIAKNDDLSFARKVYGAKKPMFEKKEFIQSGNAPAVSASDKDIDKIDRLRNIGFSEEQVVKNLHATWRMAGVMEDQFPEMTKKTFARMNRRDSLAI